MGEETKYIAKLIVQDGLPNKEIGKSYLIQVDTKHKGERFFIDAKNLVLRILEGAPLPEGEYWLDGNVMDSEI